MIHIFLLPIVLAAGLCQEDVQQETTVPIPSTEDRAAAAGWHGGRAWRLQHEDCIKIAREHNDIILLGDSITQSFGGAGRRTGQPAREIIDRLFEGHRVGNMGISGDRTQHLLWRLQNGALEGPPPRAYVIAIGTNNIGIDDPDAIAAGIERIVALLLDSRRGTPILLCPILPRGLEPGDPARMSAQAVNDRIRLLVDEEQIRWIECEDDFVKENGALRSALYADDGLHLALPGYEVWGRAIKRSYMDSITPEAE
jgi:lysophospholipase L1-like esterase